MCRSVARGGWEGSVRRGSRGRSSPRPTGATALDEAQRGEVVLGELPVAAGGVRRDLLGVRRAGDDRGDAGRRGEGRDRELEQAVATLARERLEGLDAVEGLVGEPLGPAGEAGALGRLLAAAELAGQQPAREREVRDEADAELVGER